VTVPRAIVLTSTYLRHRFVANRLAETLDVVGVWQEEKSFMPERYAAGAEDEAVIAEHFTARDASEALFFEEHQSLRLRGGARLRMGAPGLVNDADEIAEMSALSPDVVLVFGTGLLGGGIIQRFAGRILNLHLGLSPYYRGAGTNFWPLVNREPEFVGATIHYLDAGIDTGPIIAHARPAVSITDGPHEIGNKAIAAGADALVRATLAHAAGTVASIPQSGKGRLYQRKDFSAEAVRTLRRNFATGMIAEYLANKSERDARLQLVEAMA
jgi:methionyl-tRNA formyltransferase